MKTRKNDIFEGCREGKAGLKRVFYLYLGVSDVQVRGVKMPQEMLYGLQSDGFWPEEEGDVCCFVAFSAKSCLLGYGVRREIRVFVPAVRWTPEYENHGWTRWTK